MIYAIGDSHVSLFRGDGLIQFTGTRWQPTELENVAICHLGPVTIRSLAHDPPPGKIDYISLMAEKIRWLKESDDLILVFGEIDFRCRLFRNLPVKTNSNASEEEIRFRKILLRIDFLISLIRISSATLAKIFYLFPWPSLREYPDTDFGEYRTSGPKEERIAATHEFGEKILNYPNIRFTERFLSLRNFLEKNPGAYLPDQTHLGGTGPREEIFRQIKEIREKGE